MSHIELVDLYADMVMAHDQGKQQNPLAAWLHVREMLSKMYMMPVRTPDEREKFCRWLGFVQGVLWNQGRVTIDELRDQTRDLTYD